MPRLAPDGVYVPHVTPFKPDGSLDKEGLRALVDFWVSSGLDGLVPCGSNGEAPYLSREERREVVETVLDAAKGGVKVIAGTGGASTEETIAYSRDAAELGVDGLLVITPFFFRLSPAELVEHYKCLCKALKAPIMAYNVPKFTGFNLEASTVAEVARLEGIIGIKDSGGSIGQIAEIVRLTAWKQGFSVMAGTGDLIYPALTLGAKGAIVAVANVAPKLCTEIYRSYLAGDLESARCKQLQILELNRLLTSKYGVGAVKEALNLMGLPAGLPRRPLLPLGDQAKAEIRRALEELSLV